MAKKRNLVFSFRAHHRVEYLYWQYGDLHNIVLYK